MTVRVWQGLVVLALVAGGCGGEGEHPAAAPTATTADACVLVTKAEAEGALGGPVVDPKQSSGRWICQYVALEGPMLRVSVTVLPGASPDQFERQLTEAESTWKAKRVAVPDLGEQAYMIDRQLIAFSKGKIVSIAIVSRLAPEESRSRSTALMKTALERLG